MERIRKIYPAGTNVQLQNEDGFNVPLQSFLSMVFSVAGIPNPNLHPAVLKDIESKFVNVGSFEMFERYRPTDHDVALERLVFGREGIDEILAGNNIDAATREKLIEIRGKMGDARPS